MFEDRKIETSVISPLELDSTELLCEKIFKIENIDVLHVQHEYGIFRRHNLAKCLSEFKSEKRNTKIVITLHTVFDDKSNMKDRIKFQESLNDIVDIAVVHNALSYRVLKNYYRGEIVIIPHGTLYNYYDFALDNSLDEVRAAERRDYKNLYEILARLRKSKAKKNNKLYIYLPGFIRNDKNIHYATEVSRAMAEITGKDVKLIVTGSIKNSNIASFINNNEDTIMWIRDNISFNDMIKLGRIVDLIILPYKEEKGYSVSGILHQFAGLGTPIAVSEQSRRLVELSSKYPLLSFNINNEKYINVANKLYNVIKEYNPSIIKNLFKSSEWSYVAREHYTLYRGLKRYD